MKNIIYALIFITLPVLVQGQTCCNRTATNTDHCLDGSIFQIYLAITSGGAISVPMTATYTECSDGTVHYVGTGTSSSGDVIDVDITFGSATTVQPSDSPKYNACGTTNTSGWTFYTTTTGTITSSLHGIYTVTRMGPSFQVGNNANEFELGFGASGWFFLSGGDGYYNTGDINFMLSGSCTPVCDIEVEAGANQTTCAGESVNLSALATSSAGGISYTWDHGLGSGANQTVSPTTTTIYTVTASDANGCTHTDQLTVNVHPNPNANAGADQSMCEGDGVTLTASGGSNYAWSHGLGSGATKIVNPTSTTTYTVTVTDANACSATDEVTVTVNEPPVGNAGPSRTICLGESVVLFAGASTSATCFGTPGPEICTTDYNPVCGCNGKTYSNACNAEREGVYEYTSGTCPTGSGGNYSFDWDNGLGSGDNHSVSPTTTTTYNVTITDNDTGCTDVQQVTITVSPTPTISVSIDNDGTTSTDVCSGTSVNLAATAAGGTAPYDYLWNATGGSFDDITSPNPSWSMLAEGTYTLTLMVTDANGCIAMSQLDLTIIDCCTMSPTVSGTATICEGDNANLNASGGENYLWSTGETTASITVSPLVTTTYNVTISSSNCTTDAVESVTITVTPLPNVSAGDDVFRCIGETSFSTLTATGASAYIWSTGETSPSISVMPTSTTNYTVTGTSNGCSAQDEVTVFIQSCGGGGDTIGIVLSADIILGGAGDVGGAKSSGIMMHDKLREAGLIPLTDPYGLGENTMPFILRDRNGQFSVVDWVKIELRDKDDMSVVACKAALVRRDGHLIDPLDENADPEIAVPAGDYYVVIKHRSHAGVMSAAPVPLSDIVTHPCDFTDPSTATWGSGACYLEDGYMMMYGGNGNGDNWIRATGPTFMNDASGLILHLGHFSNVEHGYSPYDYNMDGVVRVTGPTFLNDFSELLLTLGHFSTVVSGQTP